MDNGLGIKSENHLKMFKLFGTNVNSQSKVNVNGIGLGLMISKMIVENFDGVIDFASEFEKGSVFFFTFSTEKIESNDLTPKNLSKAIEQINQDIPLFESQRIKYDCAKRIQTISPLQSMQLKVVQNEIVKKNE